MSVAKPAWQSWVIHNNSVEAAYAQPDSQEAIYGNDVLNYVGEVAEKDAWMYAHNLNFKVKQNFLLGIFSIIIN